MTIAQQLSTHFHQLYFGGNWTSVNLKNTMCDIDYKMATTKIADCNTIAALFYHINYYITEVLKVFKGEPLTAHDKYSYLVPAIENEEDWTKMLEQAWTNAEEFASCVERIPETKLGDAFTDEKYGNFYRNIAGIIEHSHYHMGQIVMLKKMLNSNQSKT